MTKKPKLKILGLSYTIDRSKTHQRINCAGGVLNSKQKIVLAKDMCFDATSSALLHEVIEVLKFHLSLNISHKTLLRLEIALLQFFRDNDVNWDVLVKKAAYKKSKKSSKGKA